MCTMQEIREENWYYSVFVKDILVNIYASLKILLLKNAINVIVRVVWAWLDIRYLAESN